MSHMHVTGEIVVILKRDEPMLPPTGPCLPPANLSFEEWEAWHDERPLWGLAILFIAGLLCLFAYVNF